MRIKIKGISHLIFLGPIFPENKIAIPKGTKEIHYIFGSHNSWPTFKQNLMLL